MTKSPLVACQRSADPKTDFMGFKPRLVLDHSGRVYLEQACEKCGMLDSIEAEGNRNSIKTYIYYPLHWSYCSRFKLVRTVIDLIS